MNPATPHPTPADDQAVSAVAERLGRPIAIGALATTFVLLAWFALAPTAVEGPLTTAAFDVPATIVTGPDTEGCLRVADGRGDAVTHCVAELAVDRGSTSYRYRQASWSDDGTITVADDDEEGRRVVVVDATTGAVIEVTELGFDEPLFDEPDRPVPDGPTTTWVGTDGDRVLLYDDASRPGDEGDVVLDLDGPPGFALHGAALSPDGAWVVAVTERDDVVVAPVDGSAPPALWTEDIGGEWLDLDRAIHWDG